MVKILPFSNTFHPKQLPYSSSFPCMYKSRMDAPKDTHCSSQIQHSSFLQQKESFHSTRGKRGVPQNKTNPKASCFICVKHCGQSVIMSHLYYPHQVMYIPYMILGTLDYSQQRGRFLWKSCQPGCSQ